MITKIQYEVLDESIKDASEVYFWENAVKISPKFIDGFISYESEWIDKRMRPFYGGGDYQSGTMLFGTSVIKNKPVVMMNKK